MSDQGSQAWDSSFVEDVRNHAVEEAGRLEVLGPEEDLTHVKDLAGLLPPTPHHRLQCLGDHAVAEAEGSSGKLVIDPGVEVVSVVKGVAGTERPQSVHVHEVGAYNCRQPFFVDNVLILGNVDLPSLLVECLTGPVGVEGGKGRGESVVLPHEQSVEDDQVELLIHPEVASKETVLLPRSTRIARLDFSLWLGSTRRQAAPPGPSLLGDLELAA